MTVWKPMRELPKFPYAPGKIFIYAIGFNDHSEVLWHRDHYDLVSTRKDGPSGISDEDFVRIMREGGFTYIEKMYWAPVTFPPFDAEGH